MFNSNSNKTIPLMIFDLIMSVLFFILKPIKLLIPKKLVQTMKYKGRYIFDFNSNKTIPLMLYDLIMPLILFVLKPLNFFVFKPIKFLIQPTQNLFLFVLKSIKTSILFFLSIPYLLIKLFLHSFHWIALAGFIYIFGSFGIEMIFGDSEYRQNKNNNNDYDYYSDDYYEPPATDKTPGVHWVEPYSRSDGTNVRGHYRSNPDGDRSNNLNSK